MAFEVPFYWVDAFSSRPFSGNPAAVCPLEVWPEDGILQSIAFENNLAETAYFTPLSDGLFHLRWFTPACEIDLCGHATLASAYVIMTHLEAGRAEVRFQSRSGELRVTRDGELYVLDFPARPPKRIQPPAGLGQALGMDPDEVWLGQYHMAIYETETRVRALAPDYAKLNGVDCFGLIATAPGTDCDFVSRFFAPRAGINEDPVTGSAHCTLVPYWSERLGKKALQARQLSQRGGELICTDQGERILIAGLASLYATGTIHL